MILKRGVRKCKDCICCWTRRSLRKTKLKCSFWPFVKYHCKCHTMHPLNLHPEKTWWSGTISDTLDLWKGNISCLNLYLVFTPIFLRREYSLMVNGMDFGTRLSGSLVCLHVVLWFSAPHSLSYGVDMMTLFYSVIDWVHLCEAPGVMSGMCYMVYTSYLLLFTLLLKKKSLNIVYPHYIKCRKWRTDQPITTILMIISF